MSKRRAIRNGCIIALAFAGLLASYISIVRHHEYDIMNGLEKSYCTIWGARLGFTESHNETAFYRIVSDLDMLTTPSFHWINVERSPLLKGIPGRRFTSDHHHNTGSIRTSLHSYAIGVKSGLIAPSREHIDIMRKHVPDNNRSALSDYIMELHKESVRPAQDVTILHPAETVAQ